MTAKSINRTMRRLSTLASLPKLCRSIATLHGGTTATSASATHRLLQVSFYTTASHPRRPPWSADSLFSGHKLAFGVAGTLASTSLSQLVPKDVVLYQYEACLFCNKVKAFLDYYDIPYKIVEVNPLSEKEIKFSEYKKVPILIVDGGTAC